MICLLCHNHCEEYSYYLSTIFLNFDLTIPGWWFQPTPLKNISSSVGTMTFSTEWKDIKVMFQTTNQKHVRTSKPTLHQLVHPLST